MTKPSKGDEGPRPALESLADAIFADGIEEFLEGELFIHVGELNLLAELRKSAKILDFPKDRAKLCSTE